MKEHNYVVKIREMEINGQIPRTKGVYHLHIYHDNWCGIYKNKLCDCDPELKFEKENNDNLTKT